MENTQVSAFPEEVYDKEIEAREREQDLKPKILQEKIYQAHLINDQLEFLQKGYDVLHEEIKHLMVELGLNISYGQDGRGYSTTARTSYNYPEIVQNYLEEKGKLDLFKEIKINRTKIKALVKEGLLTFQDMEFITKYMTVDQGEITLKKEVRKDFLK